MPSYDMPLYDRPFYPRLSRYISLKYIVPVCLALMAIPVLAQERVTTVDPDLFNSDMADCTRKGNQIICTLKADAGDAEPTLESLAARIKQLEARIDELESQPINQMQKSASKTLAEQREDFEQALDLGEFALRRFFGVMEEIEQEAEKKGLGK